MFYDRYLETALSGRLSRNKVRLLFGARQTGKTALLQHLLAGERTHFVDLQAAADRRRYEADPAAFGREVRALPRSVRTVVVDEIQKVPALLDEIQYLYAAHATLAAYVDHYMEEEIRREALVRDIGPFAVFLRLAAGESGQQINLARLSQESGVAAATLKNYYQVLVDTFVGYRLPAYARRTRKRLLTTPRFYLFDLGVRNAAAELPLEARLADVQAGPLLEHWAAQELFARAGYRGRGYRLSFWRTASGAEVDFVWESPREDVPIEVKWTARPRPSDARHLEAFIEQYPSRTRRGLLVCRCTRPEQLTDRVRAIAWHTI